MSVVHTQGPWTYVRNPENTRFIIDSEPHHAIATTAGYGCDDEDVARLIAAAPDLLALAYQYRGDLRHPPSADSIARRIAWINGVIAKATGDA
mgnify:CR=1 FL=1